MKYNIQCNILYIPKSANLHQRTKFEFPINTPSYDKIMR